MKKKRAFTLVELLVVISIIALLVSILMPALGKARFQAKVLTCMTNLHQWGQIINLYAAENNGRLPAGAILSPTGGTNLGNNGWDMPRSFFPTFDPSLPDVDGFLFAGHDLKLEMYLCPTMPGSVIPTWREWIESFNAAGTDPDSFGLSPAYNWWIPRLSGKGTTGLPTKDGTFLFPQYGGKYTRVDAASSQFVDTGRKWPVKLSSKSAKDIPIMTDAVMMSKSGGQRDLSHNPIVDKSDDVITDSMGPGKVFGFHATSANRIESVNQVFVDGHVFNNKTADIQIHYQGATLYNLW